MFELLHIKTIKRLQIKKHREEREEKKNLKSKLKNKIKFLIIDKEPIIIH